MAAKPKSGLALKAPVPVLVQRALDDLAARATIVRKARGLTQADLAHLADVGVSTVAAIEGGRDGVSLGNLLKVLSALEILQQADSLFDLNADQGLIEFGRSRLKPAPRQKLGNPHHGGKDE